MKKIKVNNLDICVPVNIINKITLSTSSIRAVQNYLVACGKII